MQSIMTAVLWASAAFALPAITTTNIPTSINTRGVDLDSRVVEFTYAFTTGAGTFDNYNYNDNNGRTGHDEYKCYSGNWTAFPDQTQWIDFDIMWNNSIPAMKAACKNHGLTPDNTFEQIGQLWNSIQQVAKDSFLDHRFILSMVLQESTGCLATPATQNGVLNPGIMQTHAGSSFIGNAASHDEQGASITQMVIDGVQGTSTGPGLVQAVNKYGNIYEAAREYNSGVVDHDDLNAGMGATAGYVLDIANRMTGWMYANQGTSGACSVCGVC